MDAKTAHLPHLPRPDRLPRQVLVFAILLYLFIITLAASAWGGWRSFSLVSLATDDGEGVTLDYVLNKFGRPQYAFAPESSHVVLWYRAFGHGCLGSLGFLGPCQVALQFRARDGCDRTSPPNCYYLVASNFPVSVKKKGAWLSEDTRSSFEYQNSADSAGRTLSDYLRELMAGPAWKLSFGPPTRKVGNRAFFTWRTDFPPPVEGLASALGMAPPN